MVVESVSVVVFVHMVDVFVDYGIIILSTGSPLSVLMDKMGNYGGSTGFTKRFNGFSTGNTPWD